MPDLMVQDYSVSIVIPCRNEKDNVEDIVKRTPFFGSSQEFIFVEGHSRDGTYQEVKRVIAAYPDKDIKLFRQYGIGKNDAVCLGFAVSKGKILMIFDADLTVIPEDLPKFYFALRDGAGQFISGSRLILPMEKGAMPKLNLLANRCSARFVSWLLGQRFTDVLCGTKVMFSQDYEKISMNRYYFGRWDPWGDFDLLLGAARLGLKIMEVPVYYKCRRYGRSQIRHLQDSLQVLIMFIWASWKIKIRKWN